MVEDTKSEANRTSPQKGVGNIPSTWDRIPWDCYPWDKNPWAEPEPAPAKDLTNG